MTRYQQLAMDLGSRIARGEFILGTVLPSEQSLAAEYGVSRSAVRNALGALAARGLVEPERGNGWVISSALQTREFAELHTFTEWAEDQGLRYGGLIVESRRDAPSPAEVRSLRIGRRDRVLRLTRVRTLDERPVMIERTVYAPWVAPFIESLPPDEPSIVRVLLREGITVERGARRVDAVAASREDARLLLVARSSPILRVRREFRGANGRMIEVGEDRYLGGAVSFAADVVAKP